MLSVCVIIICVNFGLIDSIPIRYKDPLFQNYESFGYNDMTRATRNLIPEPGPEIFLRSLEPSNSNDEIIRENEYVQFIKLPAAQDLAVFDPLPPSSYFEHGIQAEMPLSIPSPIVLNSKYLQAPYEMDPDIYDAAQALNTGSINIEDPYEVDLFPFVHTSISAALNQVPPVNALPPVYATNIHEAVPSLETRADYDIDVLNPENSELMPPNLRITRSRRDFLEDLAHDAMLNNLLPTMPVSFMRGAQNFPYKVLRPAAAHGSSSVLGVYPTGAVSDCAIPLLLGCSPNVIPGTLSNTYLEQSPPVPSVAAYRHDIDQPNKQSLDSPRCPPGQVMGYNLQCITRKRIPTTNLTHWQYYDTP